MAERQRIQRLRVVSDRDLMRGGALPFRAELATSAFEKLARGMLDGVATAYWRVASRLI
jgi:hypothetical protein